jgi:hypothetical protein
MLSFSLRLCLYVAFAACAPCGIAYPAPKLPAIKLKAEATDSTITLSWESPNPEIEFEIVRVPLATAERSRVVEIPWLKGIKGWGPVVGMRQTFVDRDVRPPMAYRYEVRRLGAEDDHDGDWEQANVFIMVKIEGRKRLAELNIRNTPVNVLSFSRGATLITEGENLDLNLFELESDRGEIVTFPEGTSRQIGQRGRDGGTIKIKAQRASGDLLTIVARGENGGTGAGGGDSARVDVRIQGQSELKIKPIVEAGKEGFAGRGGVFSYNGIVLPYCVSVGLSVEGSC